MAKGSLTGLTVPDSRDDLRVVPDGIGRPSSVLRWRSGLVEVGPVCKDFLPSLYASLIGNHGCRVFLGPTEDLTGWVLRVYSGDRSIALFPRTEDDWVELQSWADSADVLDDIQRHGEEVRSDRPRRRRSN